MYSKHPVPLDPPMDDLQTTTTTTVTRRGEGMVWEEGSAP